MVEKTIFIVKPIYVPVEVPSQGHTSKANYTKNELDFTQHKGKQRIKIKKKQQDAIYKRRPKAPNYTNAMSSALNDAPKRKKSPKKTKDRMLNSRSPSPFSRYTMGADDTNRNLLAELNTASADQV